MLKLASTRFIPKQNRQQLPFSNIFLFKYSTDNALDTSTTAIEVVSIVDDSGYKTVPHYREKSSLFTRVNSVFPRLILPDLDLKCTFESHQSGLANSALAHNLDARHTKLDLIKLNEDYKRMSQLELKINELSKQKDGISARVNSLVKNATTSKKELSETSQFKELIAAGNEIKSQINSVNSDLVPLQELVKTVCLRLPNSLHASSLLQNQIVYTLNNLDYKRCTVDWKQVLRSDESWSFVENSSTSHSDTLPMKYLVRIF